MSRNLFVTFAAAMSCLWFDTWFTELMGNLRHDNQRGRHHNLTRIIIHNDNSDDDTDNAEGIYNVGRGRVALTTQRSTVCWRDITFLLSVHV